MPKLTEHQSANTTKLLYIGDSKSGKTGSLASLVQAGYNLYILDFDNGLDILANTLRAINPALLEKVDFYTLTDKYKSTGNNMVPVAAQAWGKAVNLLSDWPGKGKLETWGSNDILVIDSLTLAGQAAMNQYLQLNNKLASLPSYYDWNAPQQMLLNMLRTIYDANIKCNVIVLSHIVVQGEQVTEIKNGERVKATVEGSERGYPSTGLGRAVAPQIGRYFNGLIMARSVPFGTGVKRKIFTDSQGIIELANPNPAKVKKEYDLATGLAEYFAAVRGSTPTQE